MRALLACVALVACGSRELAPTTTPPPQPVDAAAPAPFEEVELPTANGLSGLAIEPGLLLWTVAERDHVAYRIGFVDGAPHLETFAITDVPPDIDLEGIAWLGPGSFAFGTEGKRAGIATVLRGELDTAQHTIAITKSIELPAAKVGIDLPPNHGAEGVCGSGNTIVAAIEGAGIVDGKRFAPVVRIHDDAVVGTYRLWLTTATGKLSALDCSYDPKTATLQFLAIERHFEVTKFLAFELPAKPTTTGDITPRVVLDLGPVLHGRLNLEGIARAPGITFAIVDNQWKTITGPSKLLVFRDR